MQLYDQCSPLKQVSNIVLYNPSIINRNATLPRKHRIITQQMLDIRQKMALGNHRKRRQHMAYIPPPLLAILDIPVYCLTQPIVQVGLLGPAEFAELGGVDGVAVVVERTIVCVLNPLAEVVGVKGGGGILKRRGSGS